MKVKNAIKKAGAVAGSALMVGMTMGAAQSLGEFPQPFVDDDGMVQSQIVVGSQGMQADVIGAINIAASLGQAAVQTETQTETVSTGGTGTYGWTATGGETLDTQNDNLYFARNLTDVRDTLTADHLDSLADTTFEDDGGTETDIEFFLYPGEQEIEFGQPSDRNNEDPILYVRNPASASNSDYLFHLQANMEDDINFTESDVQDQEINLFGDTWTVSTDSTESKLILLGSQTTVDVDTGESTTVTVGGSEVTIEAVAASDSDTGSFRVDGTLYEKDEEQTVTVNGEQIRLDEVVKTGGSDSGAGVLQFAIGSDEYTFQNGQEIEDDDGDDIDGTLVEINGGNNNEVDEVSSIDVYVGAEDDDAEYVMAGETYSHSLFEDYEFHFGGLNPDAGEGAGTNVGEVVFDTSGDDTVTVDFSSGGGDDATVEFLHNASGTINNLADDDNDAIEVHEANAEIAEDEFFVSDAGDFAHLWEVTNIDRDHTGSNIVSGDEATIDLKDVVSGQTVEVDLDVVNATSGSSNQATEYYGGTEIIDGQTYNFVLEGDDDTADNNAFDGDGVVEFKVSWGDGTSAPAADTAIDSNIASGTERTLYAPLDLDSGSALAFGTPVNVTTGQDGSADDDSAVFTETLELPSTESTDSKTVDVQIGGTGDTDTSTANFSVGSESSTIDVDSDNVATLEQAVGQTVYTFRLINEGATNADTLALEVSPSTDNSDGNANNRGTGATVILPEDDNDEEHSYFVDPSYDNSDDEIQVTEATYSGSKDPGLPVSSSVTPWLTNTLESDDDVTAGYDFFGTHTLYDSDDQHQMTFHIPDGQSAAGAAFTGPSGSLSAGGGGGSGSVTYTALAGTQSLPDMSMLDTEVTSSVRQNSHLILVGGPAVNQLVNDLASDNAAVWSQQDWIDNSATGNARLNYVADAFTSGQDAMIVAGYSASDTRGAARYIANYADNQASLSGQTTLSLSSADYPTAN